MRCSPEVATPIPFVLGSASPRRHKLLRSLGLDFEIMAPQVRELSDVGDPVGTVIHNALAKHVPCRKARPGACVITADTLVWFAGQLIGKPRDLNEAADFLRAFSGRIQIVYTAVALSLPAEEPEIRVSASAVRFKTLDEPVIAAYLACTNPLDRAGAYDIDENGERLIAGHSGSLSNIMGLPLEPVDDWLRARKLIGGTIALS